MHKLRNSRRRHLVVAAAWMMAWASAGAAPTPRVEVAGVTFEGEAVVDGQALQLNGVGLRAVAWLKGYAAGLYLPQRGLSTAAQVLAAPGPKRLKMQMLHGVSTEEFIKAFHKGVLRNTPPAGQPAIAERMARFEGLLRKMGKVNKYDVVDLDWLPGRGLQLVYNGQKRGEPIPGEDLYRPLLLIFIGERPVDPEMKIGLLGGPVG
jgi:hypothetical protein